MPRDDTGLLVIPGSITSQLKYLSSQVLHDSCHVNRSPSTHPLGVVTLPDKIRSRVYLSNAQPEKPMDPANRKLEACSAGSRFCLSLYLTTLSTA